MVAARVKDIITQTRDPLIPPLITRTCANRINHSSDIDIPDYLAWHELQPRHV